MADTSTRPTINVRDLVAVLKLLPPGKSVLIVGPHGIGKSQITKQIAKFFGQEHIDRRLAQMTEGDMIGMPVVTDDVTRFLPVDWFMRGCNKSVTMLLDELNRATMEIMNAAFQVILDRELNGNKLHPETRVFACINAGSHYSVNEMDHALVNRFAVFHLEPDNQDWIDWARSVGIDSLIVEYISTHEEALRFKDLDKMESLACYPTPRGWESVDTCLKHAKMSPSDVCGKSVPASFYQMITSILGAPTALGFTRFVETYNRIVSATDVMDNYPSNKERVKAIGHDAIVALLEKIGRHCKDNVWTEAQVTNLENFVVDNCNGEDLVLVFQQVMQAKQMQNIQSFHKTKVIDAILEIVNKLNTLAEKQA